MTTPDHRLALPQGTRVQDFEFHRVLGHGGFGITYLGWNMALDIPVAIKEYLPADLAMREQDMSVLPKSSGDEADFQWGLDRFLDEARVMARFKHPNIVQVQHFFQAHGTAYIVMEYVEGETLSDLLKRRGTLTEAELKHILLPLLAGLIDVHEAGILHRDIKPGNILLRAADGSPVLVDFGAARQVVGARSRSVTAVLTPGYAPIEQYSSRGHQGPWTDMYALGGVCYQALTGRVPDEAMDRIRQDPLISITQAANGKATEDFLSAIDWSLRVEEADRPQGVRVWRSALLGEEAIPEPVSKGTSTQTRQAPAPDKKQKTATRWLPAIGILLLIGTGVWWSIQEYPELFGQSPGVSPVVTEQAVPVETPGETLQEVESGETDELMASMEHTLPPDKVEAEQPTPKELALSAEEAEVARLLVAAEADIKARRLTSPAGNNAWDRYQQVLEIDPANLDAIKGMERVIGNYMELFGAAIDQEDFDKAAGYLAKIGELHPDSPVLDEGEQRLQDARQARENRLAEQERQRQAELERQRIAQAVETHWQTFEAALGEENLSEAATILNQVRDLNPEAPGLTTGEQRLEALRSELERQRAEAIQAHWSAFDTALAADDLDEAAGILDEIHGLNPEEAGLTTGEQRLKAAKVELERKREEALKLELAGEMVSIPDGTFRMGDLSGEGDDHEQPVHTVTVPAFMMGKHEVTVGQFRRFVELTEYRTDAERNADGKDGCSIYTRDGRKWTWGRNWRNPGYPVGDDHPVVCVSWNDAQAFIEWLTEQTGETFRLPTEAEWEDAARAGSTTQYHFGNSESQLCRYANHADTSTDFVWRNESCSDGVGKRTAEVGSYQPNSYGLYDMHGNVTEWVQDCWNDSYVGAPTDGSAWVRGDCGQRVVRGGALNNAPRGVRSASRDRGARTGRFNDLGFRLVQDQ